MRGRVALLLAAVLLAACQAATPEVTPTPDPAAVPSGSPIALGATPTGPIVELGSGVLSGVGWRYLAYPSDSGWCTQLETAAVSEADCSGALPKEGSAFGHVSKNGRVVHGIATAEAATVWVVVNSTPTVPALLLPLTDAGLEGSVVFLGVAPAEGEATHVMAVRLNGEVLGTEELP